MRATRLAAAAAVLLALLLPLLAEAHAELVSAEPTAGATLSQPPSQIILTFNEDLAAGSTLSVSAGLFEQVEGLSVAVAGPEIRASLAEPLAPGNYTVQWVAASDDGHNVQGSYQFGVASEAGAPAGLNPAVPAVLLAAGGLMLAAGMWAWRSRARSRSVV